MKCNLAQEQQRVWITEPIKLHRILHEIVTSYPNIVVEDLHILNLVTNQRSSRCILEQGWSVLKQVLTCKSKESAGRVVEGAAIHE